MRLSTRSEIERILGNRHTEKHPFKRNKAGMEWFSRMLPLVQQLTKSETEEFLVPLLDSLLPKTDCCLLAPNSLRSLKSIVRKNLRVKLSVIGSSTKNAFHCGQRMLLLEISELRFITLFKNTTKRAIEGKGLDCL